MSDAREIVETVDVFMPTPDPEGYECGGFVIMWKCTPYNADFEVVEIIGRTSDGERVYADENGCPYVDDIADAERYITGNIKWDGCAHLSMDCIHFCSADDFARHILLVAE